MGTTIGSQDSGTAVSGEIQTRLREKSIAVGSGKGGVGKSTTALNVALLLAKQGRRVGLLDLDPLSNVTVILDVPEERLATVQKEQSHHAGLDDFVLPYSETLDIVFPHAGTADGGRKVVLFSRFAADLAERYDVMVWDMPAGINAEENLSFLPFVGSLLLVTNAEPTAHVSAGGYLRSVFEIRPDMPVHVWHNRYRPAGESGFDPRAVVANYNRYVEEPLQIRPEEEENITDIAFVPPDPALNLLQTELDPTVTIYSKLRESIGLVFDQLVRRAVTPISAGSRSKDLIAYFVTHTPHIANVESYIRDLDTFLAGVLHAEERRRLKELHGKLNRSGDLTVLSVRQERDVRAMVSRLQGDELYTELTRVMRVLDDALEAIAGSQRGFMQQSGLDHPRIVRGIVPRMLSLIAAEIDDVDDSLQDSSRLGVFARNAAAVALFLIAADKEFDDAETRELLRRLVPEKGSKRDRYTQIRRILARDEGYHRLFYQVVRTVFPGITRRISALNQRFSLAPLLLRKDDGEINAPAYVKLSTHLLHDVVNGGLGISISATYNAASQAMRSGVDRLVTLRSW